MIKHFRPTLWWMIRMTLDCVRPTKPSVIQIIHHNVGLKCFFLSFAKMCVCYNRYIYIVYIYIFHKVVQRRIYGVVGYLIITLLHIVRRVCQWQNFKNWLIIGKDMDKIKCHIFCWLTLYVCFVCCAVCTTDRVWLAADESLWDLAHSTTTTATTTTSPADCAGYRPHWLPAWPYQPETAGP